MKQGIGIKIIKVFFTLLGISAILFGMWLIEEGFWAVLPISAGVWWIYEVHKREAFK